MAECNSVGYEFCETPNIRPNLNDQQQFKPMKLRITLLQRLKKENYFNKSLIDLSVTTSSISIASFTTVIEGPVGTKWKF